MSLTVSPQCAAGTKRFGFRWFGHAECEDLQPDGSGCACECHAVIATELAATGIAVLDDWPLVLRSDGCGCCGAEPSNRCGGLLRGSVFGSSCQHDLSGSTLSELRRSIAVHLLHTQHVILEKNGKRGFHVTRKE